MENTLQVIKPLEIIPNIHKLQDRLNDSSKNLVKLTNNLGEHKDLIREAQNKVDDKWFSNSPSKSELFELIKSDQKSNSETTIAIGKLFKNVNLNTDNLAKMVKGLAQLSCMTYEDLNKSINEINLNKTSIGSSLDKVKKGSDDLNDLISFNLQRAKKEHEKEQLLNEGLQKIETVLDETITSVNNKIGELDASIQQVQFLKELNSKMVSDSNKNDKVKKELKIIKVLSISAFIFSIISVAYIVTQY